MSIAAAIGGCSALGAAGSSAVEPRGSKSIWKPAPQPGQTNPNVSVRVYYKRLRNTNFKTRYLSILSFGSWHYVFTDIIFWSEMTPTIGQGYLEYEGVAVVSCAVLYCIVSAQYSILPREVSTLWAVQHFGGLEIYRHWAGLLHTCVVLSVNFWSEKIFEWLSDRENIWLTMLRNVLLTVNM